MSVEPHYTYFMSFYLDSSKNNPSEGFHAELQLDGLDSFIKSMEKYFFSEVIVRNCNSNEGSTGLSVELNCNLSLVEMLFHFNKGTWGNFSFGKSSFYLELQNLTDRSNRQLDIEELSLFFKDTSIIINKIYEKSIPRQLENILNAIGKHYVNFSKGLTETPYEIFVPVFEESGSNKEILLSNIEESNHSEKDYFKYWALYFDSEDDAVIYDLKKSRIEDGDLFMINN